MVGWLYCSMVNARKGAKVSLNHKGTETQRGTKYQDTVLCIFFQTSDFRLHLPCTLSLVSFLISDLRLLPSGLSDFRSSGLVFARRPKLMAYSF